MVFFGGGMFRKIRLSTDTTPFYVQLLGYQRFVGEFAKKIFFKDQPFEVQKNSFRFNFKMVKIPYNLRTE